MDKVESSISSSTIGLDNECNISSNETKISINPELIAIEKSASFISIASENPKRDIESFKGPIQLMTLVFYSFFLIVIGTAERSEWAPNIRVTNFLPYCTICIVLLEINRIQSKPLMRIVFPLYSSNIPFAYMVIFSREAHVLISLLFFASCLCIFIQSGIPQLRKHLLIFIFIFMVNYASCLVFMNWFYVDTQGKNAYRGKMLDRPIEWGEEITILISMALLGACFLVLEKFIKQYANCLLEQSNQIKELEREKQKLEYEIKSIQYNNHVDLNTPIDKIIIIIRNLLNSSDLTTDENKTQLIKVLTVLSSNKIYDPIFNFEPSTTEDNEVYSWLRSMINREVTDESKSFHFNKIDSPPQTQNKLNCSKGLISNPSLYPDIDKIFEKRIFDLINSNITNWDFPIFELNEISNGNPLFYATYYLFIKHRLFQKFHINEYVFRSFISTIESGYNSANPYHNSIHATDVLLTYNYFIEKGLGQSISDLELLAILIGCVVHDYKHEGFSNHFHINTRSRLALKYNDVSIMENFHLHQAFKVIYAPIQLPDNIDVCGFDHTFNVASVQQQINPTGPLAFISPTLTPLKTPQPAVPTMALEADGNIHYLLENLSDAQKKEFREIIISLVLSTDMANHFDLVGKFKSKLSAMGTSIDCVDKKDRYLLMQIAMKCSDISNPAKSWSICKQWTDRITEEFYKQGDQERSLGMTVSAFMDRNKPSTIKCQISFIKMFVDPLYELISTQYHDLQSIHKIVKSNLQIWEGKEKEIV